MKWKIFIVTVLVMLTVSVSGGTAFAAGRSGPHPDLPEPFGPFRTVQQGKVAHASC